MKPLRDCVVIEREDAPDKSAGGIVLPDNAKDKSLKGKVLAVGPGRVLDSGELGPMQVKVRDTVLFGRYVGVEVPHPRDPNKTVLIMAESEILAIVE